MSPCSVYPGRLPASLWLASDSPHEEWPRAFRGWRKSRITPQRAGPRMLPLLPSPGGAEKLFQTSTCRDISNSLITSWGEAVGGYLFMGTTVMRLCEESSGPAMGQPWPQRGGCGHLGVPWLCICLEGRVWASLCELVEPHGQRPVCVAWWGARAFQRTHRGGHGGMASPPFSGPGVFQL